MPSGSRDGGNSIPFDAINAAALAQLPSLLREWFPDGKRVGHEWRVGSINGEVGESFSVNMQTGKWAEFDGLGETGADVIGLYAAKFCHGKRVQAALDLASKLGIYQANKQKGQEHRQAVVAYHRKVHIPQSGRHAVLAGLPDRRQRVFPAQVERPNVGPRQAGRPENTLPLARTAGRPAHNENTHHRGRERCRRLDQDKLRRHHQQRGRGQLDRRSQRIFRDRHVYVHEDNDEQGRKRAQRIARALHPIAASVRIIRLPGLERHGDVSDWLESDLSGARLVKECESTPLWDPSAAPPPEEAKEEAHPVELKKKQADVLIELASSVEFFHDCDDVGYARLDVNGHKENWPIRSKGFKRWLARGFYESMQSAPSSEAMQAALGVLEARAQFDAPEHEVYVRVGGRDNCIYIDLADRDWRAIEIDEDGWRIIDNPPVYFRRSSGMKALPEPVAGSSLNDDLRPLLNVKTNSEFVLDVAWLLAALRPIGPYPVEALTGEHGSAKTMRSNFLRALIDPNSVPLRALPRDERDLYIAARNSHVLGYDNASGLPEWLSDAFCRLATGGGFGTRELYTDLDEVLFRSKRPIILNGIDDVITRSDLADRSIAQTCAAIEEETRKLETELWAEFERKHPRILGALLTAVSHGLKTLPDVVLDRKPRMADFAVWVTACEGALWKKHTFMAAYTGNIQEAAETVLENDQVAAVLRTYMDETPQFAGTASKLLEALNGIATEAQQKTKGWPKCPADLGKILRRIAQPLRKIGIDVAIDRDNRQRWITIAPVKVGKTPSQPSPPSFSNSLSDVEKVACRHRAVTDEAATVTSDGSDREGNGDDGPVVTANPLKNKDGDRSDSSDGIFPNLTGRDTELGVNEMLGPAPAGERCALCGKGSGVKLIKHGGEVDLWHEDCGRRHLAAMANPPFELPDLGPDPLDEHGAPLAAHASAVPSDARARPWPGLSSRAVDQLAREFSGRKISSAAELEDAIRLQLAKSGVPPAAIDVEIEKVKRRIAALSAAAATVVNAPAPAVRVRKPAPYEVLSWAPPGSHCAFCGKGLGGKRIKHGGEASNLHSGCVDPYLKKLAEPAVEILEP